jgi:hypothetical protein
VRQSFDLRNVVYVQHSDGSLQPNDRIAQVLQRLAPHALVDGDTYHYSEADQESIRLIGTPSEAGEEASDVGRVFRQRLRGFSQYEWVKTGDGDRLDACYILHGLPLGQLSSMPDMFWEYHGDAFLKRALHLQPEWEQLDEIYEPPTEQHTQEQTSLPGEDRPSGSLPQPPGSLPRPAHELPDAGDHDAAE